MKAFRLALFSALVLQGCAFRPIYVLRPADGEEGIKQIKGHEYISASDRNVSIELAFENHRGSHLVFQAVISNGSGKPIVFDPSKVHYRSDISDGPIQAIDPERMMADLDKRIENEKRKYENAKGRQLFGDLMDLAFKKSGDTIEEMKEEAKKEREQDAERAEIKASHRQQLTGLESSKQYWKEKVLWRSKVEPGAKIEGRIHLPVTKNAGLVVVHFGIDSSVFQHRFVQELQNPRPESSRRSR